MNIVGKGIAKIDGMSIATGKPVYTDDLAAKEALVVKILRSPHPYAIIEDIDIKRASQNCEALKYFFLFYFVFRPIIVAPDKSLNVKQNNLPQGKRLVLLPSFDTS